MTAVGTPPGPTAAPLVRPRETGPGAPPAPGQAPGALRRWWRQAGPDVALPRWGDLCLGGGLAVLLAVCVVLRFWTRSDMWLDEALTVDIARLPAGQIHGALMRDGAPPLYYFLLHLWMKVFGTSDLGARSLSGVLGVATLGPVWLAGRRVGGRAVAVTAVVLVATSPFAIYYSTEARMYSLVALLTALGFLALDSALRRPRPANVAAVAVVTAGLLYTHYWAIYLVAVTGAWLAWQARFGPAGRRRGARHALLGVVVGGLAFVPWLPTLVYQFHHTGTPWAGPANFAAMVDAVSSFAGGPTNQGRALALLYFALGGLGLFGMARDRLHIDLDLRTRPGARALAIIVVGTLALAITGGYFSSSAFSARYAMVVFVPLLLLVSLGFRTFADRRVFGVVLLASALFGMVSSLPNISSQRSQAVDVAAFVATHGRPGDVVAYCPDQLGPDTARLLTDGRYRQLTFPRRTSPVFVDWVDYATALDRAQPVAFAHDLEHMVRPGQHIWYVWAPGYQGYGAKCDVIAAALATDHALTTRGAVAPSIAFYEQSTLTEFTVKRPAGR